MNLISFILPSRSNLKYLKQAYRSIRENSEHPHEICMADDFSDDGTWEWMTEIYKKDKNVQIYKNYGPERLGHTILYDTLVDMAKNDRVMIFHADMYLCPGADEEINKLLKPGKVVSLTRIEPPLHPDGPEKVLIDFGIEPEEFKEKELLDWIKEDKETSDEKYTDGIFAPWCIMKDDFLRIHGHDPLYAPQSKEDSDIFNRFMLAGYEFIQTWQGYVYHMTCRGSRFADGAKRNPDGQVFMKGRETDEWLKQNHRSTRNFIRKWGSMVQHNEYLRPIIPPKYDIGLKIHNCTYQLLYELEPYCSQIYLESDKLFQKYLDEEQKNCGYDLGAKLLTHKNKSYNDVMIEFDARELNNDNWRSIFLNFPRILEESGEPNSEFILDIFKIKTKLLDNQVDLLVNSVCK